MYGLVAHIFDIVGAYLNGELKEKIYMKQIPRYEDGMDSVLLLQHTLYGLWQSGCIGNEKLIKTFIQLDFMQLFADQCVYIRHIRNNLVMMQAPKSSHLSCLMSLYILYIKPQQWLRFYVIDHVSDHCVFILSRISGVCQEQHIHDINKQTFLLNNHHHCRNHPPPLCHLRHQQPPPLFDRPNHHYTRQQQQRTLQHHITPHPTPWMTKWTTAAHKWPPACTMNGNRRQGAEVSKQAYLPPPLTSLTQHPGATSLSAMWQPNDEWRQTSIICHHCEVLIMPHWFLPDSGHSCGIQQNPEESILAQSPAKITFQGTNIPAEWCHSWLGAGMVPRMDKKECIWNAETGIDINNNKC